MEYQTDEVLKDKLKSLVDCKSITEIHIRLNLLAPDSQVDSVYHFGTIEVEAMLREQALQEISILSELEKFEFELSPKIYSHVAIGERYHLIALQYSKNYQGIREKANISLLEKDQIIYFKAAIHRLASHGFIHPFSRGLSNLLIVKDSRAITLDQWGYVSKLEPSSIEDFLRQFDTLWDDPALDSNS